MQVWTSEYQRTRLTARHVRGSQTVRRELNEINAGQHDNLTYEEIAERFPAEFSARDADKLGYRYPGPAGESYLDVVARLRPVVAEIADRRRTRSGRPLLVVAHQATLRCVLTLLQGGPLDEMPYRRVPLHTVMEVEGGPGGEVRYHRMDVGCVDTFRDKPDNCAVGRSMEEACSTVPRHS